MKGKKRFAGALAGLMVSAAWAGNADTHPQDTTRVIDIEEVVVIASPKETGKLRQLPAAVSLISQREMQAGRVNSLKSVSALVPNFFMPDYGSRLTSAIYIRGIGSRINTPAVGLYVDNIPYIDKSAFDFNFYDIERIDILRGPQGTLYGRNTMGGLVKVHTRSPFSYQGTDVKLGYGSRDNHRSASLTHYHRWNERFAFSAGGYYEGSDGFFRNAYSGRKTDGMESGGGRIRAIWFPSENWKLDFTLGYDYSDEGGYPYYYVGTQAGEESYPDQVGRLAYNRDCGYRRGLLNGGLNVEWQTESVTLNAITGFQNLNDRMFLDQDFLPVDIYTIEQRQRLNTLSEEITLKNRARSRWQWVTGLSGFHQWLHTDGPVDFKEEGVSQMIEGNVNRIFSHIHESNPRAPEMALSVHNRELRVGGGFDTPVTSVALFHQSTFRDVLTEGLSLTAGVRLEYEKMSMDYLADSEIDFDFLIKVSPAMQIPLRELKASPYLEGTEKNDYVQLLPKLALQYDLGHGSNLYASVTKGYRSGGYNVQMFSELIRNSMQYRMVDAILGRAPEGMKDMMEGMIAGQMPGYGTETDVRATTVYKPEYSWNYEAGAHLTSTDGRLKADFALFYMDTHDQQIARFVNSGLGRMMVNAGSSESYGAEAGLQAELNRHWHLNANYGYTRSTFRHYDGGTTSASETLDYSGNYVPFVPRHTVNVGAAYQVFFQPRSWVRQLTFDLNYTGAGKIYWTEKNNVAQPFYGTLNGRVSLRTKALQVDLWGSNLTGTEYTTFYFESMDRGFEQRNKPARWGVDLRCHF